MKKKKIDTKHLTAESLVSMAKEQHAKVMQNADRREKEHEKTVADLTEVESRLKAEIATAKEQLGIMVKDFEVLEQEQEKTILAKIEADKQIEKDVESGKITMGEYVKRIEKPEKEKSLKSKYLMKDEEGEIPDETEEKSVGLLEKAVDLIRKKAHSIAKLEVEFYSVQSNIFSLTTQPVKSIRLSYHELIGMLDYQLEGLNKDGILAQSLNIQKKNEINLIERGASVNSAGYSWKNITLKTARQLKLDPIFPRRLVPMLEKKLTEFEGDSKEIRLSVVYHQPGSYWPGDEIEVREELQALPREKFKIESKPVTTKD